MLQITTPNGVGGLLYKLIESVDLDGFERVTKSYRERRKGDLSDKFWHKFSDDERCFFTVHWRANPMLDEDWAVAYRSANNISDLIWEIEFEISPAVGGCRLVAQQYIDDAIISTEALDSMRRAQCVVAGLDTNAGTIDNDFTSLSPLYQQGSQDKFYLRKSYYNNTEDHPAQIEHILDELFAHRPQRVIIESNNAGTIFHTYLKEEYPLGDRMEAIFTTGQRKEMAIQTLVYLLQAGRLLIEEGHPLIQELPVFEMRVKNNHRTYGAREGYHDDAVMSTAIAIGVLRQEHGVFRGGIEQLDLAGAAPKRPTSAAAVQAQTQGTRANWEGAFKLPF